MFESGLELLTASNWAYALLLGFAAADVLFPVVPSEAALIAAGVAAGRTAATLSAGVTHLAWPTRFLPYTVAAGLFWASYATLLGYLGGRLFVDRPLLGLLVA